MKRKSGIHTVGVFPLTFFFFILFFLSLSLCMSRSVCVLLQYCPCVRYRYGPLLLPLHSSLCQCIWRASFATVSMKWRILMRTDAMDNGIYYLAVCRKETQLSIPTFLSVNLGSIKEFSVFFLSLFSQSLLCPYNQVMCAIESPFKLVMLTHCYLLYICLHNTCLVCFFLFHHPSY